MKHTILKFLILLLMLILSACTPALDYDEISEKESETDVLVISEKKSEEELLEEKIQNLLEEMPIEDKVAQLFFVTPESLTGGNAVVDMSVSLENALKQYPVGGIILFSQNMQNEEQLCHLLTDLKGVSEYPLFVGVDEEGGPMVARVANHPNFDVPQFPDMATIGMSEDLDEAYEVGVEIGRYLQEYGFNVNFAPVADVLTNQSNEAIGRRSFGSNVEIVSEMVMREVEGMQEQGISAVLKHFPGHGGTGEDSHNEAAVSASSYEEMLKAELLPFQKGIEAGADMIMIGHISTPNATKEDGPSTLSKAWITDCLRDELGFEGVIITDSMSMGAIINYYDPDQACVMALEAGNDMILMPYHFQKSYQAVLDAVKNGKIPENRIDDSLSRIYKIKLRELMH